MTTNPEPLKTINLVKKMFCIISLINDRNKTIEKIDNRINCLNEQKKVLKTEIKELQSELLTFDETKEIFE